MTFWPRTRMHAAATRAPDNGALFSFSLNAREYTWNWR